MSSGNLPRTAHPELFRWNDGLDPVRYVVARYVVTSCHDGEATATAMAMEQSAATTAIRGYVHPGMIEDWTIRVLAIEADASPADSEVPVSHLATEVYPEGMQAPRSWSVTLQAGREVFAYIVNRSTNGDHYWVFAHVTPSFGSGGKVVGYHSNRRLPKRETLDQVIQPLYKDLLVEESRHENRKEGMNRAFDLLMAKLKERGLDYDEFIFSI